MWHLIIIVVCDFNYEEFFLLHKRMRGMGEQKMNYSGEMAWMKVRIQHGDHNFRYENYVKI